ncbi:GNAT family N-acetyltransferase, partial [Mycetocola reblochoni]
MTFSRRVDADHVLVLRDAVASEALHGLTLRNLDRLRAWEPWAAHRPRQDDTEAFTRAQMRSYREGTSLPLLLVHGSTGAPAASLGLGLDRSAGIGERGFWIDQASEGRGLVSLACHVLLDEAAMRGMRRVRLRTSVANARSIAVARRLGMTREATLRKAMALPDGPHDVAVFGRRIDDAPGPGVGRRAPARMVATGQRSPMPEGVQMSSSTAFPVSP